jgi:hypothetical protein
MSTIPGMYFSRKKNACGMLPYSQKGIIFKNVVVPYKNKTPAACLAHHNKKYVETMMSIT